MRSIELSAAEIAELRRSRHTAVKRVLALLDANGHSLSRIHPDVVPRRDAGAFMSSLAAIRRALGSSDDEIWKALKRTMFSARKNALRSDLQFDISLTDLRTLYIRSGGRCEVTGIAFGLGCYGTNRAPFAPSIDRIDCATGYERQNVRLTCQIANLAMNVWGAEVLREFVRKAALSGANIPENFPELTNRGAEERASS